MSTSFQLKQAVAWVQHFRPHLQTYTTVQRRVSTIHTKKNGHPLLSSSARRFFATSQQFKSDNATTTTATTATTAATTTTAEATMPIATQTIDNSNANNVDNMEEDIATIYHELKQLSAEIRRHDELYYNFETEQAETRRSISDEDYDALVRREEEICTQYPSLMELWQEESGLGIYATRYGGRVGIAAKASKEATGTSDTEAATDDLSERVKRTHHVPMLSLDNVHSNDQLFAWLQRIHRYMSTTESFAASSSSSSKSIAILTEPKLDGLSLSLRYKVFDNSLLVQGMGFDTSSKTHMYQLQWASTRGDGRQGQDVTIAAIQGMMLPPSISIPAWVVSGGVSPPEILEIRGEVILPTTKFNELQSENSLSSSTMSNVTFSNARNAASGILLRKLDNEKDRDEALHLQSQLSFYAYDVVGIESVSNNALQTRELLTEWGFSVPSPIATTTLQYNPNSAWNDTNDITSLLDYYQRLDTHRQTIETAKPPAKKSTNDYNEEESLSSSSEWGDYTMDGCVHKLMDYTLRNGIGTNTRSPKWAVAHKFAPQSAVTKLRAIEIQVGRTGALTPVAILDPIDIGGATIQRATLHNFGHLQQVLLGKDDDVDVDDGTILKSNNHSIDTTSLAKIPNGTSVLVRRAGDVIPQVYQRVFDTNDDTSMDDDNNWISLQPPTHCPACGSPTILDDISPKNNKTLTTTKTTGQVLRCGGPPLSCPPRAITSLTHAYSRDALDITGLSEARIQQLSEKLSLRVPSDIFKWNDTKWQQEVASLHGWGTKSCTKLATKCRQVATQGVSLSRFIYSLGIRHVGLHTSSLLASTFGNVTAFLNALEEVSKWESPNNTTTTTITTTTTMTTTTTTSKNDTKEFKSSAINDDDNDNDGPFKLLQSSTLGIGPVVLSSLHAFAKQEFAMQEARDLAKVIRVLEQDVVDIIGSSGDGSGTDTATENKPWHGKKVVLTGSIANMTRSQAQQKAKDILGASSTPASISKSTNLVVAGVEGGGKKLEKAREFGVQIISADEFLKLLRQHSS